MDGATIGDDIQPVYQFTWDDGRVRTSEELGDFEEAGLNCTIEDLVDAARDKPDCTVEVIGFTQ